VFKKIVKLNFGLFYRSLSDIKFYFKFIKTISKLKRLSKFSHDIEKTKNKTIVFNMVRTYIPMQLFVELILAFKYKKMGWNVVILHDDSVLNHHETLTKSDKLAYTTYYPARLRLSRWLLGKLPIIKELLYPYSKLNVSVEDLEVQSLIGNELTYQGVCLSEYIEASLVRFFLSAPDSKILKQEEDYQKALYFFCKNALLSYKLARSSINKFHPDLLVTSHGIYSTWGVFMRGYLNSKINVITYGGNGYTTNALDFGVNDVAANKIDNGYYEYFIRTSNQKNKDKFLEKVDVMMRKRANGLSADTKKIKDYAGGSNNENMDKIKSIKNKKIFALFPNVMWDNATTFKSWNTVFSSPVEWLVETVEYFQHSKDKVLIIRSHPAEYIWMDVRVTIKDILYSYFGKKIFSSPNIIFIPSYEKLISYDLFPFLDGAIVYNGTIGLELMYDNVPLIIGAKAAYSNKNFTHDLKSKEQYFDCFKNINTIENKQRSNKELLKLFIYEYFFVHGVPLKLLSSDNLFEANLKDSVENIWNDKNLDFVLSVMNGDRKYFQEWKSHA